MATEPCIIRVCSNLLVDRVKGTATSVADIGVIIGVSLWLHSEYALSVIMSNLPKSQNREF